MYHPIFETAVVNPLLRAGSVVFLRLTGRASIFRWPFRGLVMWLGGIPVQRERQRAAYPAGGTTQQNHRAAAIACHTRAGVAGISM